MWPSLENSAVGAERIFELRTHIANPGKLQALHARFRDHTCPAGVCNLNGVTPEEKGEHCD
jgi:hypothetical protein